MTTAPVSARAEAVTRRTYNRPLDESADQYETWEETVDRSMWVHHERLWTDAKGDSITLDNYKELGELEALGTERKALVAGRTLWLGGTEYAYSRPACQFNCSYTRLNTVYDMVDAAWLLLNGSGVGGKAIPGVLRGYDRHMEIEIIPSNNDKNYKGRQENIESRDGDTWIINVGDSAPAWAKALGKILAPSKFARGASKLRIETSECRGPGGRLKGYGWICNGPEPLTNALRAIHELKNAKCQQLLDEIDIGDIHNWFGTILSSRRSAEILLCDSHNPNLKRFRSCKDNYWETGQHQRRQSNNSELHWTKPTKAQLREILHHAYLTGDPAPINAEAALRKAPWFDGVNPCFAPGTLIVTSDGARRIETLVGETVQVHDGKKWVTIDNFRVTGYHQPTLKIEMQDGSEINVTPSHTMVLADGTKISADEIVVGDRLMPFDVEYSGSVSTRAAYLKGFLIGDGTTDGQKPILFVYAPKFTCATRLSDSLSELPGDESQHGLTEGSESRKTLRGLSSRSDELMPFVMQAKVRLPDEVFQWDRQSKCDFLAGLFDADGCALDTSNGFGYQLSSVSRELLSDVQCLLKSIGVPSKVAQMYAARKRDMPGGTFDCQQSWRLSIAQRGAVALAKAVKFERLPSFADKPLKYNVKSRANTVVGVTPNGIEPVVYCCTVPDTHTVSLAVGVTTGQCVEILLANHGFCNLCTSALPRFSGNFAAMNRAVYLMGRANYRQTCVNLDDGVLQKSWHQTNESLRLCGVSATGIVQADWLSDYQIRQLRNSAVLGAYSMADELGLPRPAAVTTIKPEGTSSKICDVSEGMHTPIGKYIFNWIAFSTRDPFVEALRSAGYKIIASPTDPNNVLVCFDVEYPNIAFTDIGGGKFVNMESAVTQLNRYRRWNTLWADHNVSATISFDEHEIPEIVDWLDTFWDDGYVACAFMRRVSPLMTAKDIGQPYLPQEVQSYDDFMRYKSSLRPVEWGKYHRGWHEIADAQECAGGVCPIR